MASKNRGRYFPKRKKQKTTKNPFFKKLGPAYDPTEEDLKIAYDRTIDPNRFSELITLNSLSLSIALLEGGQLALYQKLNVAQNIANMPKTVISTAEKSELIKNVYAANSHYGSNSTYLQNLMIYVFSEQSKEACAVLDARISQLTSNLDKQSKHNLGVATGLVSGIEKSELWEIDSKKYANTRLFWSLLKYHYFAGLEPKTAFNQAVNEETKSLLSSVIKFKERPELDQKFENGLGSNPLLFAELLKARVQLRADFPILNALLDLIIAKTTEVESVNRKATVVLQKKAEERKARAKVVEAEKRAHAARIQAEINAKQERLIKYRATGFVNAEGEFSVFLKDLKFYDDKQWDLDALGEFLRLDLKVEMEKSGFHLFLNKVFRTIDHPLIAHLCSGSTIEITTADESKLRFMISGPWYGQFELKLKVERSEVLRKLDDEKFAKYAWEQSISPMKLSSPWGLKNQLEHFIEENQVEIKSAVFVRPRVDIDLINLVGYVYGDPVNAELVSLYFKDWRFFTDGYPCDKCGRELTHAVSAVKGVGPVCGDHSYSLDSSDADRIRKHLERVPKSRLLNRNSPLIRTRLDIFRRIPKNDDDQLLLALEKRKDLGQPELLESIQNHIDGSYLYSARTPRIAWGNYRARRRRR